MAARRKDLAEARAVREAQHLAELQTALTEGWKIEPPVLLRPGWSNRRHAPKSFYFVLILHERRQLFVLDDTPTIRRFLAELHLSEAVVG